MREDVPVASRRHQAATDTAAKVLDVAERLLQTRGYNGFSYADVAAELRLTKASLHYHYASKATLGEALIARYATRFATALTEIDARQIDARQIDAPAKLTAYARLYADVLRGKRMCMCGMLAAEYRTLPKPMRDAVIRFFDENEAWLTNVLGRGRDEGTLRFRGSPSETAQMILSGLEGAMLVARPYDDTSRFQLAADRLLENLVVAPAGRV
jgi:TetR/AcrR family transcriptional repressor of nem operon